MLVGLESKPDDDLGNFLAKRGVTYISYSSILAAGRTEGDSEVQLSPKIWSFSFMRRERTAFRNFINKTRAAGIVVSAGTPGIFAGAAGATKSNLHILHTYPHGRRHQDFGRTVMRRFFKRVTAFVSVSQSKKEKSYDCGGYRNSTRGSHLFPTQWDGSCRPSQDKKRASIKSLPLLGSNPIKIRSCGWKLPWRSPPNWDERMSVLCGWVKVHF